MTDEELILMYQQYKNKRRIIIIVIIFLICVSLLVVYKFPKLDNNKNNDEHTEIKEEVLDSVPPDLKLIVSSIEIIQDEEIDYISYIESAIDDIDGDLKDKVEFNEIDTSIIGEQIIVYFVSDSANNSIQKELLVNVKEKEVEVETPKTEQSSQDNKKTESSQSKGNTSNNSNSNSSNNGSNDSNTSNNTSTNNNSSQQATKENIVKYFLFSDGYTMANVTDACVSELKKYNRTGMCSPIQDENGIYLGMKLEIN